MGGINNTGDKSHPQDKEKQNRVELKVQQTIKSATKPRTEVHIIQLE